MNYESLPCLILNNGNVISLAGHVSNFSLTLNTFSTLIVYAYMDGWYTPCHSNMVFIFELNHTSSLRSNMNRGWVQIDNEFMLLLVLLLSSSFFHLFFIYEEFYFILFSFLFSFSRFMSIKC